MSLGRPLLQEVGRRPLAAWRRLAASSVTEMIYSRLHLYNGIVVKCGVGGECVSEDKREEDGERDWERRGVVRDKNNKRCELERT